MTDKDPKRRPLLAYGERLSQKAVRGGMIPNDKFHPRSLEQAWTDLAPKASTLMSAIDVMRPDTRGKHVVVEATLYPNYLASSYFPADILDSAGLYIVGSRVSRERYDTAKTSKDDEQTKTLLLAGKPDRVKAFAHALQHAPSSPTDKFWLRARQFSDVQLPQAARVLLSAPDLAHGEVITWEAVLTHIYEDPALEAAWADEHFMKWTAYVESIGGRVDATYRRDVKNLTFVPVELSGDEVREAARFNLLRAIRPMPTLRPLPTEITRVFPGVTRPSRAATEGRIPGLTIAAFDGGVNPNISLFAPFVTNVDLTSEAPDLRTLGHGSLVTSALLYGHVNAGATLPDPPACVTHYRVLPVPKHASAGVDVGLYWILDQLVETVRRDACKLVSLSIGPNESVEDAQEPTRWTAELDVLSAAGVTFVSAVGNNGADDPILGLNRVQAPGDMVNGVSVGACATQERKAVRAPYSAVGPGREGQRIAPSGVAFGGSDLQPFVGIDAAGRLANTAGTSFAAPTVARSVASLWGALSPERHTPALTRAFCIHFAERRKGHKPIELGHGRFPERFDEKLECAANEVSVLYEDELPRAQVVAMRFPLPEGLAQDLKLVAEWTIAYTSDVDPRDASDYTLHGLDVTFRPNEAARTLTEEGEKLRTVDMRVDSDLVRSALTNGAKLSNVPLAHSGWRPKSEISLRESGKWETVVRGRVNLLSQDVHAPRLDIVHLRRADGRLVTGDGVPPLRIAMLLTMRAPTGVQLYDSVALSYPVLAPLVTLPLRLSA